MAKYDPNHDEGLARFFRVLLTVALMLIIIGGGIALLAVFLFIQLFT